MGKEASSNPACGRTAEPDDETKSGEDVVPAAPAVCTQKSPRYAAGAPGTYLVRTTARASAYPGPGLTPQRAAHGNDA